ncbi:MAG: hypothetical protein V1929_05100 [bacterium]
MATTASSMQRGLGYPEVREALFLVSYYRRLVASLHGQGYAVAAAEIPTPAAELASLDLASTIWRALGAALVVGLVIGRTIYSCIPGRIEGTVDRVPLI